MKIAKIIFTLLLCGSVVSCIKAPGDGEDVNSTPEEIGNALAENWGAADPLSMKINDFVYQETTQKVETNPEPYFMLREGITVSGKTEDAEKYTYKYAYQFQTVRGNTETPLATKEDSRTVSKPQQSSAEQVAQMNMAAGIQNMQKKDLKPMSEDYAMSLGFEKVFGLAYACIKSESTDKYCKESLELDSCDIQCANLTVKESMRPVPDEVKARPNCDGYANCMWRTKTVAFDWIINFRKGTSVETHRVNYLVNIAQDLPFIARMTDYCFRQLLTVTTPDPNDPMNGRKVLVNTCTSLKNFKPAP